jgi:5-oxopent-3-ene-1,2,5-tricarboxylate decarboxylase/2-hydroxyhepta-2,4-diene-1,7-dioate isomerase
MMADETTRDALTDERIEALKTIATSTLAHQLQMRGIRSAFFSGLKVMHPHLRMVGRARTLRYVALREDLQGQYAGGMNAQRRAVEALTPGDVLVIEGRGVPDAATIGDIFASRAFKLGATGIVTDGALRDTPAIAELQQPVYHLASHGATFGRQHMPFSVDEPVTCAGVFVVPGDVIVGDGEGAVVIPIALLVDVVKDALVQEERERFALEGVAAGESTVGLFPLSKERMPDFEKWSAARKKGG